MKYMVEKTLSRACKGKTPAEILDVHVADIACGSGIFLEEAFSYLQSYCVQKYLENGEQEHLLDIGNGLYKLPLDEKKRILCSCIHPVMGGHADRRSVHYGAVVHYDYVGVRQIF